MTCADCRKNFTDYLQQTLGERERKKFERHLRECNACAADLANFEKTVGLLEQLEPVAVPDGLLTRILSAVDEQSQKPATRKTAAGSAATEADGGLSWQRVGAWAVAAVMLIGLVVVLHQGVNLHSTALPNLGGSAVSKPEHVSAPTANITCGEQKASQQAPDAGADGENSAMKRGESTQPDAAAPQQQEATGRAQMAEADEKTTSETISAPNVSSGAAGTQQRRDNDRQVRQPHPPPATDEGAMAEPESARKPTEPQPSTAVKDTADKKTAAKPPKSSNDLGHARLTRIGEEKVNLPEPEAGSGDERAPGMEAAGANSRRRENISGAKKTRERAKTYSGRKAVRRASGGPSSAPEQSGDDSTTADRDLAVDLTFLPPEQLQIKTEMIGTVIVKTNVELSEAVLKVTAGPGMNVINTRDNDVLYEGRIDAQDPATFAIRMIAQTAGERSLRIRLSSELEAGHAELVTQLHGFTTSATADGEQATKDNATAPRVNCVFKETPIRDAFLAITRQTDVKVAVGDNVAGYRVNAEFQDVPVEAALRILCGDSNCTLTETEAGYAVTKP